ncbi:MAG: hypothetical protein HYY84_06170 [Deltaproteobacteria bacterium]|nr:hypothetical protein [Deltaproteobacteria bacterium]
MRHRINNVRFSVTRILALALAVLGCQAVPQGEGELRVGVTLADDFNTSLVTGLRLVIDGANGAALPLVASNEAQYTVGAYRFTAQVKNADADPDMEFVVTFATNPFTGRRFDFKFHGNWGADLPLTVRATILLEGAREASASADVTAGGDAITLVKGVAARVPIQVACTPGVSCAGTMAAPVVTATSPASPANQNAPRVRGQTLADVTVRIYATADCASDVVGQGTGAELATDGIAVTVADNSTSTFYATATDAFGNVSPCSTTSITYIEDSIAPAKPSNVSTTPESPGKSTSPKVKGTAEADAKVNVFANSTCAGAPTATGSAALYGTAGIGIAVANNAVTALSVNAVDRAGNVSPCASGLTYFADNATPTPQIARASVESPANENAPRLIGTAEATAQVDIFTTDDCAGSPVASDSAATFTGPGIEVQVENDTATAFYARATDLLGNVSDCSAAFIYTEDSTPPATPTGLSTSPTSPANHNRPFVVGTAPGARLVELFTGACGDTLVASGGPEVFSSTGIQIPTNVIADNSVTEIFVRARDTAGNASDCASLVYVEDSIAPEVPTIARSMPASPANLDSPNTIRLVGTAPGASTIALYTSPDCLTPLSTIAAAIFASTGAEVTVEENRTTTFYAKTFDGANESACSAGLSFTEDGIAPLAPTSLTTSPRSPSIDAKPRIIGNAEQGSTALIFASSDCSGAFVASGSAEEFAALGIEVDARPNDSQTFSVRAKDRAGNLGPCSAAPVSYLHDDRAPEAPTDLISDPSSPANNNYPRIKGNAEPGAEIRVYATGDCTGDVWAAGNATEFAAAGLLVNRAMADDSTTRFSARAIDGAGNASRCSSATASYVEDSTAPAAVTALKSSPVSPSNEQNPLISGAGAESDGDVEIFANATCAGTRLAKGPAVEFNAKGIKVAVAENSTAWYYVRAVDRAGNFGPCSAGIEYTHNGYRPEPPKVASTNPASPANLDVLKTGGKIRVTGTSDKATTVSIYTGTGCDGEPAATGTREEFEGAGIALSVKSDHETKIFVRASNGPNQSDCGAGPSFVEDRTPPDPPSILGTSPASPNKSPTIFVRGIAEARSRVDLFANDGCAGAPVVSGASSVFANPGLSLTNLLEGLTKFTVRATDEAGNVSRCSAIAAFVRDATPPVAPSSFSPLSTVTSNSTPLVKITAEPKSTIRLFTNSACAGTPLKEGVMEAFSTIGFLVTVPLNTKTNFYAQVVDEAGNSSACAWMTSYTHDSLPPAAPTGLKVTPVGPANNPWPTVSGAVEADILRVFFFATAGCSGNYASYAYLDGQRTFSVAVPVERNKTTTIRARTQDRAGNSSPCSTESVSFTEDSAAPVAPTGLWLTPSPANNNAPVVKGTAEAGSTVQIFVNSACGGTPAASKTAAEFTSGVALSVVDNSTSHVYVRSVDVAGNASGCAYAGAYTEDSTAPIAPTNLYSTPYSPSNNDTPKIKSYANGEAGTVDLFTNASCSGTSVASGSTETFVSTGIPLKVAANATTNIYARVTDRAGNVGACSLPYAYTMDSTPPGAVKFNALYSPRNHNAPVLFGSAAAADSDATIKIYDTAGCSGVVVGSTSANYFANYGVIVSVKDDSTTTFYGRAVDRAGNDGPCTTTGVTYVEDSTPPSPPTLTAVSPASPSSSTTPTVSGTAEANAYVVIYSAAGCTTGSSMNGVRAGTDGKFSTALTVGANKATTFYATTTDAAQNVSACSSAGPTYIHDSIAPAAPTGLSISPTSPANNNNPVLKGTAEAGSKVQLFYNSTCYGFPAFTKPVAEFSTGLTLSVGDNTTNTFSVRAIDAAGNAGACASAGTYVEDSLAFLPLSLQFNYRRGQDPRAGANYNEPILWAYVEGGSTVSVYTGSCGGTLIRREAGPAILDWYELKIPAGVIADNSQTTFFVQIVDAAGNRSVCSQVTYTEDSQAPSLDLSKIAAASVPNTTNQIALTWELATDTVTPQNSISYDICVSKTRGSCAASFVATSVATAPTTISNLDANTRYFFTVRARDLAGNRDANTGEVSARTGGASAVVKVAASQQHSCALLADGTIRCVGFGMSGQLGNGSTLTFYDGVAVSGISTAVDIAVGSDHSCAVLSDGRAACWGKNGRGQVGDDSFEDRKTPSFVKDKPMGATLSTVATDIVAITASWNFTCALRVSGDVTCWGSNDSGELGTWGSEDMKTPQRITNQYLPMVAVSAGGAHACGVQSNGIVKCWGSNSSGQVGVDPKSRDPQTNWPRDTKVKPVEVSWPRDFVSVAAGNGHTCGLTASGAVYCWGYNYSGQTGQATTTWSHHDPRVAITRGATSISAGLSHSCAVLATGEATCWGDNSVGQRGDVQSSKAIATRYPVVDLKAVRGVMAGWDRTIAVLSDGTARGWGRSNYGNLWDGQFSTTYNRPNATRGPIGIESPIQIASGGYEKAHTCSVMSSGKVKCWGDNSVGQLGDGTKETSSLPKAVAGLPSALGIAVGVDHTCALTAEAGKVFCWGANDRGQLGDGTTNQSSTPREVAGLVNAIAVGAGHLSTCALIADGTAKCWGDNTHGTLGNGTYGNTSAIPVAVSGVAGARSLAMGHYHACVLDGEGATKCWGLNDSGQIGDGTTNSKLQATRVVGLSATEIAAGSKFTCAIVGNGRVKCWGEGTYNNLGRASTANSSAPVLVEGIGDNEAKSLHLGSFHGCAAIVDGTLKCWGYNSEGNVGNGNSADRVLTAITAAGGLKALKFGGGGYTTCAILSGGETKCWGYNHKGQVGAGHTETPVTSPVTVVEFP